MAYSGVVQATVTDDGRGVIIDALNNNTNMNILTFRIGDGINDPYTLASTVTDLTSPIDLSAAGIGGSGGYIPITTITKIDYRTIKFQCYIPSGAGTAITCNEIMIYSDPNPVSVDLDEKSFICAVFPDISKNDTTGLNFEITLTI